MSSPQLAKIHVTKIAAAERQLRTAIRMFFAGEDELSIHCRLSGQIQPTIESATVILNAISRFHAIQKRLLVQVR